MSPPWLPVALDMFSENQNFLHRSLRSRWKAAPGSRLIWYPFFFDVAFICRKISSWKTFSCHGVDHLKGGGKGFVVKVKLKFIQNLESLDNEHRLASNMLRLLCEIFHIFLNRFLCKRQIIVVPTKTQCWGFNVNLWRQSTKHKETPKLKTLISSELDLCLRLRDWRPFFFDSSPCFSMLRFKVKQEWRRRNEKLFIFLHKLMTF